MIIALILLTYAVLLATAGPFVLRRAGWTDRAPRLAVLCWQALSASTLLAVALGGLALTVPTIRVSGDLLHACAMALRAQYATPAGAAATTIGGLVAVTVLARSAYFFVRGLLDGAAIRRRQHHLLAVLGRDHRLLGITLVDDGRPVVYCVAGRPHRIVLTSGADEVLDEAQLDAVLAHERAHLRERHHLALGVAVALARAFPGVPLFRDARDEIARLVELRADDAASRTHEPLVLAEAMLTLAAQPANVTSQPMRHDLEDPDCPFGGDCPR